MKIFDEIWYSMQVGYRISPEDAVNHYCKIGKSRNINPSPYFDTNWYARAAGLSLDEVRNPLEHFERFGAVSLCDPHPLFNSKYYKWNHIRDPRADIVPLVHYIEEGWRNDARPHPLFWGDWYRKKYVDEVGDINPLYHFISEGERNDFNPNPLFDVKWYRNKYHLPSNESALANYIYGGHDRRDPHPLFDSGYYRSLVACRGISPLEHYLTQATDIDPCILFDAEHVRSQCRTLSGGSDRLAAPALLGYLVHPQNDAIDPHPFFSKKYYNNRYTDVAASGIDPFMHYMTSGYGERRQPHPLFEPNYYDEQCPDLGGLNPLTHYLTLGLASNLRPRRTREPDTSAKTLPANRRLVNLSKSDTLLQQGVSPNAKVGVFAHIFYTDLCEYVANYTNNIPYKAKIYITTNTTSKAQIIKGIFAKSSKHPYEVTVKPNRGRDIAPMLEGLKDALENCDYALHIHTKKSKHYSNGFDRWRNYLFEMNLGSPDLVRKIVHLLSLPTIGAVAPDHYPPIVKLLQWGGNLDAINHLLHSSKISIDSENLLDFPSGSMFWFKPDALKRLVELNLRSYHFDPELGQVDGTLAHAIERSLFYFVELGGFEWLMHGQAAGAADLASGDLPRLRGNRLLPTDADLGAVRRYYPECTKYLVVPSDIERPRLNLLIPLVDQNKGYAGVATGISFFMNLHRVLSDRIDARIISTDVSPGNQYVPPPGFDLVGPTDPDTAGRLTVLDGARRYRYPVTFRRNDILVATAWWTADGALNIMEQQKRLFDGASQKFVYLIQDFECGFYPWSAKYSLADNTYRHPEKTIPVFNTKVLRDFFAQGGYFKDGFALQDGISRDIMCAIERGRRKEKIVLLYARPHAERNSLPFIDLLIDHLVRCDPVFWRDWRFLAIGEDFSRDQLRCSERIEVLGRLSLSEYGDLSSRAALAVSLMISPHPSYPPLELANAGVLVLTNSYANKDMSGWHDNITSFDRFDVGRVAEDFRSMADRWIADPERGWRGVPHIDWFFDGMSNTEAVIRQVADRIRAMKLDA